MTELIAVLAAAALFATFGFFVRAGHGCAGPDACRRGEGRAGCAGGCGRTATEVNDA